MESSNCFFKMKKECKVSCVKLFMWAIVAQKGTDIIISFIFEHGAEYGTEHSAKSGTKQYLIKISQLFENTFSCRTPPVAASENNEQQQLSESFANSCYKIVSPILLQELINDFAVCEHCSGTLLCVEDVTSSPRFQKLELYISF